MLKLAEMALRGPLQAASVSTGLLITGLLLPFLLGAMGAFASLAFVWCSAGVLALVLLRQGTQSALTSLGIALLLVSVVSMVMGSGWLQMILVTLQFWLPALILGLVLRRTVSLDVALAAGAGIGIFSVLMMHLLMGNPEAAWQSFFEGHLQSTMVQLESAGSGSGSDSVDGSRSITADNIRLREQLAALQSNIGVMAKLATPTMGIMMMLCGIGSVLLARSWQARLFNPGGFQQEFHQLRFGKAFSLLVLGFAALAMVLNVPLLNHFAMVLMAAVMFQGLAVMHCVVKNRGMSSAWLVGLYVLLLLPQTTALLGVLGLADNWLDLRNKIKPSASE